MGGDTAHPLPARWCSCSQVNWEYGFRVENVLQVKLWASASEILASSGTHCRMGSGEGYRGGPEATQCPCLRCWAEGRWLSGLLRSISHLKMLTLGQGHPSGTSPQQHRGVLRWVSSARVCTRGILATRGSHDSAGRRLEGEVGEGFKVVPSAGLISVGFCCCYCLSSGPGLPPPSCAAPGLPENPNLSLGSSLSLCRPSHFQVQGPLASLQNSTSEFPGGHLRFPLSVSGSFRLPAPLWASPRSDTHLCSVTAG